MRSFFLCAVLGLASLGVLGLAPSDARANWFRRPVVAYYAPSYPVYSYPPAFSYSAPVYSGYSYYPGGIYVGPLQRTYYYPPAPVVAPIYRSYYDAPRYYYRY